ncbi:phosphatidate phosphatase PAH1-like [Telopea speciosissima]|uniref:phosphatidate phosphatase PAH1-like n=1 Tax=Telopea speciosissima TaxID=54955 RepID=UPI001CC33FE3|nr:phosphatidate phosphatase PAH1-like [Telopea speciosissima]XP_043702496.1 phosphatidate phosphatase PAH1-like [Telopea speciosissima]
MNVVGKVGSIISQGVYSVATPFHPFGGAVDVIVVEQQDGSYRSTPWYVRFGKFQGVLKGSEKIVRIFVNGVEAGFHMYLDNSGEAYFIREVLSSKDQKIDGIQKNPDDSEVQQQDINSGCSSTSNTGNDNSSDNRVSPSQDEKIISNAEEFLIANECLSLNREQIENVEADTERQLYTFENDKSPGGDPVGSSEFGAYHYESLDHVESVMESQGSDSEVVLVSVDGHVLTAPISSLEENTDNVQLSTPQFHLGPGEGTEFSGGNEEFSTGEDAWAANYLTDIDASEPNLASEGMLPICDANNADLNPAEVCEIAVELVTQAQDDRNIESITMDHGHLPHVDSMSQKEVFGSCLDFLDLHTGDADAQEIGSACMEVATKQGTEDPLGDSSSSLPAKEKIEATNDPKVKADSGLSPPCSASAHNSMFAGLSIDVEAFENNNLTVERSDNVDSDSMSAHSVSNDPGWKDEQFVVAPEALGFQSSPRTPSREEEFRGSEMAESQKGTSGRGMGFEISLCGKLLYAGMGMGPAGAAFDAHRISVEEFKASMASITKNENLIVRFKERYLTWDKAAPVILGMAAFGLELPVEPKDAIPVEQDRSSKPKEDDPGTTSTPSSRRWMLWPIPFRRVKTLKHTSSNSSNEEVFVDSEPGSQNPFVEPTSTSNTGSKSPHKQLVRTNVPTTEQIASLNLKEGQNMITFSFSTRVLGNQKVDAHIYLWKWNARIVISDVDGTITKSDVLGQFMPLVGKDWTQSGVARLFSAIKENGYQLLFLSARAIVQAYLTRSFLLNLKQDGKTLPIGPVVISPDGLFPSLYREVIRRAPHEFKIACLEDIKALFPKDYNPFYAGFGNRDTDELSYKKIGIPKGKIFIINPKGEVAINNCIDVKSYTSLHTLVNDMFPPTSLVEQEDFNSWNYWKMPLPNID